MRRNLDITYLIQNNAVYGLTKGQYSPTSEKGMKTPTSLDGSIEEGVNPMALAITMGTTYAARGYAYEVKHLQELIVNGVKHKGFSFIDIFQPCSTYNKIQTIAWYKQMLVKMEEIGHDPTNKEEAMKKAMMTEKLPIGLFFKEERATYEDGVPQIAETPLVQQDINNVDIKGMLDRFK
jgi:2-oxoglutarate/2-oxoacid ferredoxin oxidoreductase subunit beta